MYKQGCCYFVILLLFIYDYLQFFLLIYIYFRFNFYFYLFLFYLVVVINYELFCLSKSDHKTYVTGLSLVTSRMSVSSLTE